MSGGIEKQVSETLKEWLRTLEGTELIDREAKILVRQINNIDLPERINPLGQYCDEDQIQEALLLIYEQIDAIFQKPLNITIAELAYNGDFLKILRRLRYQVFTTLKEQTRLKEKNPWGYVYKRARTCFGNSNNFYTQTLNKGNSTWYSIRELPESKLIDETVFPEAIKGYSSWTNPQEYVPDADCYPARSTKPKEEISPRFTCKQFCKLGEIFWLDAEKRYEDQYYLPLRTFVNYLSAFYQWLQLPTEVSLEKIAEKHEPASQSIINAANKKEAEILEKEATKLARKWSLFVIQVVYYSFFSEKTETTSAIARALKESEYRTKQVLEKAIEQIRNCCRKELPGSSTHEDSEREYKDFINTLGKICEKHIQNHNNQVKGGLSND